jgi:hypothetical protein
MAGHKRKSGSQEFKDVPLQDEPMARSTLAADRSELKPPNCCQCQVLTPVTHRLYGSRATMEGHGMHSRGGRAPLA